MTMRRRARRPRPQVRRVFLTGQGSATALGTDMVDVMVRSELGGTNDPEMHELLCTGIL